MILGSQKHTDEEPSKRMLEAIKKVLMKTASRDLIQGTALQLNTFESVEVFIRWFSEIYFNIEAEG